MNTSKPSVFTPQWPVPACIKALQTTRLGGFSQPPYNGFNLALHVQDVPEHVIANRQMLAENLPIHWLEQVHGNTLFEVTHNPSGVPVADASYSQVAGQVCAVMTADCLPVLITNRSGDFVAAVHCGWRSLASGILTRQLACFETLKASMLVWMGPAIGPNAFEVGAEVKQIFVNQSVAYEAAFQPIAGGKYLANIYQLARTQLAMSSVVDVYCQDECTFQQNQKYFSYRRDRITGRQASLIWIDPNA